MEQSDLDPHGLHASSNESVVLKSIRFWHGRIGDNVLCMISPVFPYHNLIYLATVTAKNCCRQHLHADFRLAMRVLQYFQILFAKVIHNKFDKK